MPGRLAWASRRGAVSDRRLPSRTRAHALRAPSVPCFYQAAMIPGPSQRPRPAGTRLPCTPKAFRALGGPLNARPLQPGHPAGHLSPPGTSRQSCGEGTPLRCGHMGGLGPRRSHRPEPGFEVSGFHPACTLPAPWDEGAAWHVGRETEKEPVSVNPQRRSPKCVH